LAIVETRPKMKLELILYPANKLREIGHNESVVWLPIQTVTHEEEKVEKSRDTLVMNWCLPRGRPEVKLSI